MSNIVDFEDNTQDFELPLLSELEGQTVIIQDVTFNHSGYGKYAVINLVVEGHEKAGTQIFRSSGAAIVNQLETMHENVLSKGGFVRGTITKPAGKKYFVFKKPEK